MFDPNLMIAPNVGEMIQQGIEQGQQTRQQNMAKAAMAALVRDPNNQRALEALAQVDPPAAMHFQQQAQQQTAHGAEQYRAAIMDGVPLYEKMGRPTDPAGWQQFKQAMAQTGHDVSHMPDQFDPQYVQGATQMYQAWGKPEPSAEPNIAKEVAYYKGIGRDDLAQQLLTNHANPMVPINNGDGTITLARPPAVSQLQPGAVVPDPRKQGGAPGSAPSPHFP